jgi:CubicO group peptidase (beta-lactamase class C family)
MGKSSVDTTAHCHYFCYMSLLKNILYFIACLTIVCGCNFSASKEKETDDSLKYYPPTPGKLDRTEFRHYYRAVSAFLDSMLFDRGFNGAVLFAKDGEVIFEKYTGKIHLQKKDSLTDSTSLHLASTSKTFTGVATLRLVQENKISLDDSLAKFFPGLPYPGITVRMLLNHRSGLPNYIYFIPNSNWDKKKYVTNADVLNLLYTLKPNKSFTPNTRFSYSNTNYVLLALIIEKISGKKFPDYMREKYFEPLQMKHTYVFTNADSARSAPSFNYNNAFWENDFLELTYGDKNIYSTPRDMLKWDQALYTDQVLRPSLRDSAFAPNSLERPSVHNYGLGFRMLLMPNGKKVIYHFGRWHGFNAAFARLTDEKVTIIILGNKFTRNIYNAARLSYDLFGDYMQRQPSQEEDDSPEAVTMEKKEKPSKAGAAAIKRPSSVKK